MRIGNHKSIEGASFYELLDDNNEVIGYIKGYMKDEAERTLSLAVLDLPQYKELDKELAQEKDKYGDLLYRVTHNKEINV